MIGEGQLKAASDLHALLEGWGDADEAMRRVRKALHSNSDRQSVLAKASVIDKLYATSVRRIYPAANHIVSTFRRIEDGMWQPGTRVEFVHELAKVPKSSCRNGYELLTSFASKYSHFFVDPRDVGLSQDFAIYDSFAAQALLHLAGSHGDLSQRQHPYAEFCELLAAVFPDEAALGTRRVDRFLWLKGQHLAHLRARRINPDVRALFESSDGHVNDLVLKMATE